MEFLCRKLALFINEKKMIELKEVENIRFAFELVFTQTLTFVSILLLGILFNIFFETIIYLFVFVILKHFTGGYHAKTYLICYILTVLNYFIVMLIAVNCNFELNATFLGIYLFFYGYLYFVGSLVKLNTILLLDKYNKYIRIVLLIVFFLSIIFYFANLPKYSNVMTFTIISIIIMMIVERIKVK